MPNSDTPHITNIHSMIFKTWLTDLTKIQGVVNNIKSIELWANGATGLLNPNVVNNLSSAINGLNLQQAQLALSTRNLTQEQMNQVLVQAGLIASEDKIQAELVQSALTQARVSAEKQKAILTELGLMDATTGEIYTTQACTKEELLNMLATKGVTGANAEAIISALGLASANGAATISFELLAASIWANIEALVTWLATNPVGWCVLAAAAIFGAVKAFDALTVSFDESVEKTKSSKQKLDQLTSEISDLNKELETTKDRIDELLEKANSGTISLLEEEELNTLKEQNDELQREIALKEKLAAIDAKEVAENAAQSITYKTDDNKWDDEYNATDRIDKLQKYVDSANFYQDKLSEINQQILDIEESATDNSYKDDSIYKDLIKYQKEYQEGLKKVEKQMSSTYEELTAEDDGLYYDGKIIEGYEDLAKRLDTVYMEVELYLDKDNVKDTTEDYIETIKNKLIESGLSEEIANAVAEGFSEEELNSIMNSDSIDWSACLGLNDATAVIENIKEQLASIDNNETGISLPDAKKLINGLKDGDTEIIGLIDEFSLLQEVLSDTGNIQQETYEKLLSCSAKYSTAIRTENGRITLNTTKLKQVAKSRQLDTKETIRQTLALKKQEWIQWKNRIENYNGTLLENIENTYGDIDALQQQITQYELLVNSLDNATSAFERFKAAQQTNDQDMYDTAKDAFELVNDALNNPKSENFGKFNTDDFQEAIALISSDKSYNKLLNAENLDEYVKIAREVVKTLKPLYDEDKGVDELFKRADAIVDSRDIPKNDEEWADRLETSLEGFQAFKQYANLFEYNGHEYFSSEFTDRLDEYQSLLSNVAQEQEALNAITDKSSREYKRQGMALEEVQGKLDTFVDKTTDSMAKAYANYAKSNGADGRTFAEYVKDQFDFEDTDVDGSILAMIDKADSLKQRLDSISPTEAVQKQFSEYDQLQSIISVLSALGVQYEKTADTKADFEASMQKEETKSSSDILKERVEQYKELQKQMGEAQKELLKAEPNSEQFTAVSGQITELNSQMDALREPITIEINANIAELEASIKRVTEAKNQFAKSNSGLENTMFYSSQMNSYNAQIEKDTANKAELEKTLKVVTDLDSSEVDNYNPEDKELKVTTSLDSSTVDNYDPPSKEMTVTVKLNTNAVDDYNPSVSGNSTGSNANGTFNAFATGTPSNVSIKKNEKALVNELGEEGLVRNGKLIPIKGGAQFLKLKRGDIIFNHKQMEQLKKNGYTTGRGKLISGAHADGTVYNAFSEGIRTNTTYNKGRVLQDWPHNPANPKNKKSEKKVTKEKEKKEKEVNEEIFDWIERKIKRLQTAFDKWLKQAETALTSGFITKYYKKAANAMSQLLNTQGKAYNRYMQEANAVGLDETYAKKVRAGEIDIQTIQDEELADKIAKYQEWYVTCHVA